MFGFGRKSTDRSEKPAKVLPRQLALALAAGVIVLAGYASASIDQIKTFALLFVLSGAAFLIGALVGFLFGIPKSRTDGARQRDERIPESAASLREKYWDNANLEEVSDWLTKIIVGLGLVEFGNLTGYFGAVGATVEPVLGPEGRIVLQGSILFFLVLGFIYCYLWTRLVFYSMLVDQGALDRKIKLRERFEHKLFPSRQSSMRNSKKIKL